MTLDWRVQCTLDGERVWLDHGYVLVETKGGLRPGRADRLLAGLGARPRSFSKYVAAASLMRDDLPDNDVRAPARPRAAPGKSLRMSTRLPRRYLAVLVVAVARGPGRHRRAARARRPREPLGQGPDRRGPAAPAVPRRDGRAARDAGDRAGGAGAHADAAVVERPTTTPRTTPPSPPGWSGRCPGRRPATAADRRGRRRLGAGQRPAPRPAYAPRRGWRPTARRTSGSSTPTTRPRCCRRPPATREAGRQGPAQALQDRRGRPRHEVPAVGAVRPAPLAAPRPRRGPRPGLPVLLPLAARSRGRRGHDVPVRARPAPGRRSTAPCRRRSTTPGSTWPATRPAT